MLPGLGGLVGRVDSGLLTEFVGGTASGNYYYTTVPPGITSARVSCIGIGDQGYYDSYYGYWNSGGGASLASSVLNGLVPGTQYRLLLSGGSSGYSVFQDNNGNTLVKATNASSASYNNGVYTPSKGGQASGCIGDVKYSGGDGQTTNNYPGANKLLGGGCAGLFGNGSNGAAGGGAGSGVNWLITASGLVLSNGAADMDLGGGNSIPANYNNQNAYPASPTKAGAVIEWGYAP